MEKQKFNKEWNYDLKMYKCPLCGTDLEMYDKDFDFPGKGCYWFSCKNHIKLDFIYFIRFGQVWKIAVCDEGKDIYEVKFRLVGVNNESK